MDKQSRLDTAPILEINDLCVSYFTRAGEIPAVVDFSLSLRPGESMGLVGESGCGKSTVAMAIMRYMGNAGAIVSGQVKFKGCDMAALNKKELRQIRGSEIAMIYQEPMTALNPSMTIGRQLMEVPITHDGVTVNEAYCRSMEMLGDVHLPDPKRVMNAYPHQISGGQQQRVVIAMALLSSPSLLLLDEPTTALDVTVQAGIVELIASLSRKFNMAMLYISHNLGLMFDVCDRIGVMYSGEIVEQGHVNSIFSWSKHPYTYGLFGCIPLPHTGKNARRLVAIPGQLPLPHERPKGCNFGPRCDFFQIGRCDQENILLTDTGDNLAHRVRCLRWNEIDHVDNRADITDALLTDMNDIVLDVDHMKKYYEIHNHTIAAMIRGDGTKLIKANEDINFNAVRGETIAIVGESGCGKSTFAKVLMGLETATSGEVRMNGINIAALPVKQRSSQQLSALQMIFQNPDETLNPSLTIGEQISRVIKKFGVERDPEKIHERVLMLFDMVKLPREFERRKPRQLSGGQKQRVAMARAFAGNPSMIIADEPISALDVSVAAAVIELLMDIQRENKTTLLFISHDLSTVRYLSNRVVVMYLGRIMESGSTDQVFSPPYHPYTEALLSAVPIADPEVKKRRIVLEGNLPSALDPPKGCPFVSRCPRKLGDICDQQVPAVQSGQDDHVIACHIPLHELCKIEPVIMAPD